MQMDVFYINLRGSSTIELFSFVTGLAHRHYAFEFPSLLVGRTQASISGATFRNQISKWHYTNSRRSIKLQTQNTFHMISSWSSSNIHDIFKINVRKQFSHTELFTSPAAPSHRLDSCWWGDETIMYASGDELTEEKWDTNSSSICERYFAWLRNMTPRCGIKRLVVQYKNGHSLTDCETVLLFSFITQYLLCIIAGNKSWRADCSGRFCCGVSDISWEQWRRNKFVFIATCHICEGNQRTLFNSVGSLHAIRQKCSAGWRQNRTYGFKITFHGWNETSLKSFPPFPCKNPFQCSTRWIKMGGKMQTFVCVWDSKV